MSCTCETLNAKGPGATEDSVAVARRGKNLEPLSSAESEQPCHRRENGQWMQIGKNMRQAAC